MLDSRVQKKKRRKREREAATVRRLPMKKAEIQARQGQWATRRSELHPWPANRVFRSDVQRTRDRIFREHVFAGDCGGRRDAGSVEVTRPCATGSGRANTETNSRHHHQPSIHPSNPPTTTVNDAAPSPPTPSLPPPYHRHYHHYCHYHAATASAVPRTLRFSTLQPLSIATTSTTICSSRVDGEPPFLLLSSTCRYLPTTTYGMAGRYWRPLLLSNPVVSFFSIHLRTSPSPIRVLPSLLHLSYECMCK